MPSYNPNKDKFLNHYFEKNGKNKDSNSVRVSSNRDRKSAKTLPTQ